MVIVSLMASSSQQWKWVVCRVSRNGHKKISLTYWHTDEYQIGDDPSAGVSPEADGWVATAH